MRTRYRASGPFRETPYYTSGEFERLAENALQDVGALPTNPQPIRIDWFIEKKFGVTPQFEDLPVGVLGMTVFSKNGVAAVLISRELGEDRSLVSERRVRTTLAHEAGHGICQGHLVAVEAVEQGSFGDWTDPSRPRVLCREDVVGVGVERRKYHGEWAEYQANQVMACLLLPRKLVFQAIADLVVPNGTMGLVQLRPGRRAFAEQQVSAVFDVNKVVASYRLQALFPETTQGVL